MANSKKPAKAQQEDDLSDIPHLRKEPRPDFSKDPLPPAKLPESLQQTLDSDEKFWAALVDGRERESTDSSLRYAGYASRIRTILLSAQRYVAYTSDIGESFRPVAHPRLVRAAYAVSWLYVGGDVAHEGYKAYLRNQRILSPEKYEKPLVVSPGKHAPAASTMRKPGLGTMDPATAQPAPGTVAPIDDYRSVMAQRFIFQSLASMGLPAFTIHSVVRYSGKAMKNVKNMRLRTWGHIGLGLAVVPALPYLFDKPVEHAVETVFHKGFELIGGPAAVGQASVTGREALRDAQNKASATKEKDL